MNILLVPQSEVCIAWPVALPLLRKANVPLEEMDEEQVFRDLRRGLRQLWLGENGSFACLTELNGYPENVVAARIYMLGGKDLRAWYVDLFLFLYAWAKKQGASRLQIDCPRPGWTRVLAHLGFILSDPDTLVKEIN